MWREKHKKKIKRKPKKKKRKKKKVKEAKIRKKDEMENPPKGNEGDATIHLLGFGQAIL
jgi:hypothetical protein